MCVVAGAGGTQLPPLRGRAAAPRASISSRAAAPARHQMLEVLDKYVKSPNSTSLKFPSRKKKTCPGKSCRSLDFKLSVPGISESPDSKFPLMLFKNIPSPASRNPNGELSITRVHSKKKAIARPWRTGLVLDIKESDPISAAASLQSRDSTGFHISALSMCHETWALSHMHDLAGIPHILTHSNFSHIEAELL